MILIADSIAYVVILALVVALLWVSVRVLREYERGVVFTLGRFSGVRGPGLIILVPLVQQMQRVDLRMVVMDVPSQDVISRDNVSVKVNAVVYFRVVDADRSVIEIEDHMAATSQLAQTTLRSVLGKHDLDEMLAERDKLNRDIQAILDSQTDAWGIKVANVEIKHVDIDESMVRAIARQAEAERNRRGRVIDAEGELQAAEKLGGGAGAGGGARGDAAPLPLHAAADGGRAELDRGLPGAAGAAAGVWDDRPNRRRHRADRAGGATCGRRTARGGGRTSTRAAP
jgi:regulator of protease activity HflC (stomatin/prohibitin superfamily)